MVRRLRLTCETCGSFLHETKQCKKAVARNEF